MGGNPPLHGFITPTWRGRRIGFGAASFVPMKQLEDVEKVLVSDTGDGVTLVLENADGIRVIGFYARTNLNALRRVFDVAEVDA